MVSADDGLDEISVSGPTRVIEVRDGATEEWFTTPEELGFTEAPLELIAGGTPEENAAVVRAVLDGSEQGPARDVVLAQRGRGDPRGRWRRGPAGGVERARRRSTPAPPRRCSSASPR